MLQELEEGKIQYIVYRVTVNNVSKGCFIAWMGGSVQGTHQGKFNTYVKDMEYFLKGRYHHQIIAHNEDEVVEAEIIKALKVGMFDYDASNKQSGQKTITVEGSKQSLVTQEKVVQKQEVKIDKGASDKFWNANKPVENKVHSTIETVKIEAKTEDKKQALFKSDSTVKSEKAPIVIDKSETQKFWQKQQEEKAKEEEDKKKADEAKRQKDAEDRQKKMSESTVNRFQKEEPVGKETIVVGSIKDRFPQAKKEEPVVVKSTGAPKWKPVDTQQTKVPPPFAKPTVQKSPEPEPEPVEEEPEPELEVPVEEEPEPELEVPRDPSPEPIKKMPPPFKRPPGYEPEAKKPTYLALYEFEAGDEAELSFPEGAVLTLIEKDGDWWTCEDENGNKGLVPGNYLQEQ